MAWYLVLLILVCMQGVFLLVWWLLNRRHTDMGLLRELAKSASRRIDEERKAERKTKEKVADAYRSLAEERKKLVEWYNENRAKIDDNARRRFEELAGDSDAIDRKLDELLGTRTEDDTKPGLPVDPASTVEEG